jgi:hypothetical protein
METESFICHVSHLLVAECRIFYTADLNDCRASDVLIWEAVRW